MARFACDCEMRTMRAKGGGRALRPLCASPLRPARQLLESTRLLMPSLRFAPYREIASEIAARLAAARGGCDPLAPWDEEVIVPSRGAAEGIAGELLKRLPRGIAGLQLQSLDELAKRILASNDQTP